MNMPQLPNSVIFRERRIARFNSASGPIEEYVWKDVNSDEYFNQRRVVLFGLPGAFTPTCSSQQLPGFEALYQEIRYLGVDAIYCISVNDSFVMNAWFKSQGIQHVHPIPDGNGEFTSKIGMMVDKNNLGFGPRSWRYAAVIENGEIVKFFEEPGRENNCPEDPYGESSPEKVLEFLREHVPQEERTT